VRFYYGVRRGLAYWSAKLGSRSLRALGGERAHARFLHDVGRRAARRPVEADGDDIRTGVPESYVHTNAKLRAALRHVLSVDGFDYLLRTNTASYVDLPGLRALATALPGARYYGGFVGERDGLRYVSGTGILLSRDLVETCAFDPDWRFDQVDDVAVGHSMRRAGVRPRSLPRLKVSSEADLAREDELRRIFLVWCRSARSRSRTPRGSRSEATRDAALMRAVHRAYRDLPRREPDGA